MIDKKNQFNFVNNGYYKLSDFIKRQNIKFIKILNNYNYLLNLIKYFYL